MYKKLSEDPFPKPHSIHGDWYIIYLHVWLISTVSSCKDTSPMDAIRDLSTVIFTGFDVGELGSSHWLVHHPAHWLVLAGPRSNLG